MTRALAAALLVLATAAAPAPSAAASRPALSREIDDCTLATRDKPTLDRRRLPGAAFRIVSEQSGWEKDAKGREVTLYFRHGRDSARLKGGVLLTVDQGGCYDDYYNSYAFTLTGDATPLSNRAYWNRKAAALLREVAPANLDRNLPLAPLIRDLDRQGGNVIDERMLEETVRYSVGFERHGGAVTITVSYAMTV